MDEIFDLIEELKSNGFAKNNPNWRLCVVYGNMAQDGQAADRLAKYIPKYGQWTIAQIQQATPK
jgi:ribosomal protein S16